MGIIAVPNSFSANTTISSSQVNSNFNTIANEFNGSISAANLATDSVTTAKIADSNVTTAKINDDAVTTAKIADDTITGANINWSGTGADSGIWWEELGRTTLSSSGDSVSVASIPARKYLRVCFYVTPTGGTIHTNVQFNGDTGNNYNMRYSDNGGADSSTGATSAVAADTGGVVALPFWCTLDIANTTSFEKLIIGHSLNQNTAGAANAVNRREINAKWANTSAQITRVDVINSSGTGDFAIGSELVVLGHN